MFGIGPIEMVIVGVFALLGIPSALRLSRNRTATLVLQKFSLAAEPQPSPSSTVEIVGRMQGVVAFALSLLGFSPITRFTIAGSELRCESSSLFGQRAQFIPLRCIATISAGVHKPIAALIWAAFLLMFGSYSSVEMRAWAPITIALVIAVALVVMYVLTKKFFIEVHPKGGPPISLLFKPNVIEGVPIDAEQALVVVAVIRDMILRDGALGPAAQHVPTSHWNGHHGATDGAWSRLNTAEKPATFNVPPETVESEEIEDQEEQAKELYGRVRQLVQDGDRQNAISILQEIVRRFPQTQTAEQARRSLQKSGIRM